MWQPGTNIGQSVIILCSPLYPTRKELKMFVSSQLLSKVTSVSDNGSAVTSFVAMTPTDVV